MPREDLKQVNGYGRLDALAYRAGERLTRHIEEKHGLAGIWDNIEPHVQDLARGLGTINLPTELKVLLSIFSANKDKLLK